MNQDSRRYLFFITKPYSMAILGPIQDYIITNNLGTVNWFAASSAREMDLPGEQLKTTKQVLEFNPDAVLVPGNVVPHFWPGLKVQIFHGLGEEKTGHYRITGFFDLYCTPGPHMSKKFQRLRQRHKNFLVRETGWSKLDPLAAPFDQAKLKKALGFAPDLPLILYAPTFSPKYESATSLLGEIGRLQSRAWQWVVKFHDLMDKAIIEQYQKLESSIFKIAASANIIPLLQAADVMLTDTSSVAYEYLLLDRPIVTFKAASRLDKGNNIVEPAALEPALENAIDSPGEFAEQRQAYRDELHPYTDGKSSKRIVDAIDWALSDRHLAGLKRKPFNTLRKRQIRKIVPW